MSKRIIICGPSASGKTYLRKRLEGKGFKCDISYTTRKPREGEKYGVDYNFISEDEFTLRISQGAFYENVQYNGNRYGTGLYEWNNMDCFIMETDGIKHIKPEDRKDCFIIYLDPPRFERVRRMVSERNWNNAKIEERIQADNSKFENFKDYDLKITNTDF
jgi:guanylate kinase